MEEEDGVVPSSSSTGLAAVHASQNPKNAELQPLRFGDVISLYSESGFLSTLG